jgi:hypothetical protein
MRIWHLAIPLIFLSCNPFKNRQDKKFASPKGYDLREPVRYYVRQSMQEISGIVLAPNEQHMLAINDEQGREQTLSFLEI